MTLYEQIGKEKIEKIISDFYKKAFDDPIIGHFFLRVDQPALIQQQITFASNMLGGPKNYKGKTLDDAHSPFKIRDVHFNRRQVLLKETLDQHLVVEKLQKAWLEKEEKFRGLILTHDGSCHD